MHRNVHQSSAKKMVNGLMYEKYTQENENVV